MAAEAETFVPLVKPSVGFEGLKQKIIDSGLCSHCSNCAALCDRIEMKPEGPALVRQCTLQVGSLRCGVDGTCYDNCPHLSYSRTELDRAAFGKVREDAVLGSYKRIVGVKSKLNEVLGIAQDGGAVTSFLLAALEDGIIEAATIANRGEEWRTSAAIAKTKEELFKAGGTKYSRAYNPDVFGEQLRTYHRFALVGTGCQIAGMRKTTAGTLADAMHKTRNSSRPIAPLLIGLFCYENFAYEDFRRSIEKEFNVKMSDIAKTDIIKGKIILTMKNGEELKKPVKVFNEIVPESCVVCTDFAATLSDISVGSVGTEDGWSTVIVRSELGMKVLEAAQKKGYVEVADAVMIDAIKKTEGSKDAKRKETLEKREKEGKYVPTYT